jgi:hypothetical protein
MVVESLQDLLVKLEFEENKQLETIDETEDGNYDLDIHNGFVGWL